MNNLHGRIRARNDEIGIASLLTVYIRPRAILRQQRFQPLHSRLGSRPGGLSSLVRFEEFSKGRANPF